MYRDHSISVVIPCHNEEAGLEWTYRKIPDFVDEVIVVDNLSTDKTPEIAEKLGAKVVSEKNKGYGFAIKRGLEEAKGDIVITIDGDGTYPVEDARGAIDYLLESGLDFVSCSRFPLRDRASMHWQSYLGNKIISFLMSLLFFKRFRDGCSGMWVFRRKIYPPLLPLSSTWNISEEIKIEAFLRPEVRFGEYHVDYRPRLGKSKLWPIRVGIENILYLFYLRFVKKRGY